ncbi:MAG: hypothetical protein ACRDMZ_18510, partial [Solirubrobacteraceae bacterium]
MDYPRAQRPPAPRLPTVRISGEAFDARLSVHEVPTGIDLLALDHVALALADPAAMAAFLCS